MYSVDSIMSLAYIVGATLKRAMTQFLYHFD